MVTRDPGGWSDNQDGSEQDLLGKALMEVREFYGGGGAPAGNYSVADFTKKVETK